MKTKLIAICHLLSAICLSGFAQGTAFTYQGRLNSGGSPANGSYDIAFSLFTTNASGVALAGPVTNAAVGVSNGLFTTTVDFGNVFSGGSNWLQIAVSTNGANAFSTLAPRQQLTPVPYAVFAEMASNAAVAASANSVASANIIGTIAPGNLPNGLGGIFNTVNGGTVAGGQFNSATNVLATVGGGDENVAGDVGTVAGGERNNAGGSFATVAGGEKNNASGSGAFIGGGGYAGGVLLIGNTASGNASVVAGGLGNSSSGAGAFIGGGGYDGTLHASNVASGNASVVDGGLGNQATNTYATVGGGYNNTAGYVGTVSGGNGNNAAGAFAMVGGGYGNTASGIGAFIGGGGFDGTTFGGNTASGNASVVGGGLGNQAPNTYATVGGGNNNTASGYTATVAGGGMNTAGDLFSTVGGGDGNVASAEGATVPGGESNQANGINSFAAGQNAHANNDGAFVWADDSSSSAFASTANNQFLIRAAGNVGINTVNPLASIGYPGGWNGMHLYTGSGNGLEVIEGPLSARLHLRADDNSTNISQDFIIANGANQVVFSWLGGGLAGRLQVITIATNGNVGIGNPSPGHLLVVGSSGSPAYCDGTTWQNGSDRNAKEGFASVSPETVLAKVVSLPITEWNYKADDAEQKHLGPMAQDFHAAFGLNGDDDKHISTVDEGGVALAAIQGLNEKLNERDAEIAGLEARLEALEKLIKREKGGKQ